MSQSRSNQKSFVSVAKFSLFAILGIAVTREMLYFFSPEVAALNPIDFALFAVSLPYLLFCLMRGDKYIKRLSIALVATTLSVGIFGQLELDNSFYIESVLKFLFPVLLVLVSVGFQIPLSGYQLRAVYVFVFLFAAAGEIRIFGSQSSVTITEVRHSTAYLLIGVAITIWVSPLRMSIKALCLPLLVLPLLFINVATAAIALGVFFMLEAANKLNINKLSKFMLVAAVIIGIIFTRVDLLTIKAGEFGLVGSGRVAAWQDGFASFMNHGLYVQIFGQGSGSSYQYWGVWWWAQKDIHSDFLRVLIENGLLVFLVLIVGFLGAYWRLQKSKPQLASIFVSAIATSIISNGVFGRPYACVLWALAFVVAGLTNGLLVSNSKSEVLKLPTSN